MKTYKLISLLAIVASVLLFCLGARNSPAARPDGSKEAEWVKISDTAGILVSKTDRAGRISGILYVRRESGWVEAMIEGRPTFR
jgi:hypothetical protein